jgi:hypothetical protein
MGDGCVAKRLGMGERTVGGGRGLIGIPRDAVEKPVDDWGSEVCVHP